MLCLWYFLLLLWPGEVNKKRPFSLPLQTKVYCLLCTVDKDFFFLFMMVACFHPCKTQLSSFAVLKDVFFIFIQEIFIFAELPPQWQNTSPRPSHTTNSFPTSGHFETSGHPYIFSILIETQKNGNTFQYCNFLKANGCMNLTNRWCTSRTSDIAFTNTLR